MSGQLVAVGLTLAGVGFIGRYILKRSPKVGEAMRSFPNMFESTASSKYYRGGFEPKMSKREASLILGVSPSANKTRIKDAHKRIMLINHPDRGGSPYLASKINEAKDLMESGSRSSTT